MSTSESGCFTDLTSGELAYGLVHKMPTRKKHFISSDCLISKKETHDYGKRFYEKKERNGTTASYLEDASVTIWFRKNALEQKAKVNGKTAPSGKWTITKARNSLQSRKILQLRIT